MVDAACVHLWNMRNATRPKALREGSAGKPREGVDNGGIQPVDLSNVWDLCMYRPQYSPLG